MDLNQNFLKKNTIESTPCMTSMHILSFRIKTKKKNKFYPTIPSYPSQLQDLASEITSQVTNTIIRSLLHTERLLFSAQPEEYTNNLTLQ